MTAFQLLLFLSLGLNVILFVRCGMLEGQRDGWEDLYRKVRGYWEESREVNREIECRLSVLSEELSTRSTTSEG